jgi:hypothetical protein
MKESILVLVIAVLAAGCAPAPSSSGETPGLPPETVVPSPTDTIPTPSETQGLPLETIVPSPTGTIPTPSETPDMPSYSPNPDDSKFERGNVFIGESGIILRESSPVQVVLGLSGELPTPCHQLRVLIAPPDAENRILIEAYTVVNPEIICIQVLKPFQEMIELGTFPGGHYTVWVNGTQVGEFDS